VERAGLPQYLIPGVLLIPILVRAFRDRGGRKQEEERIEALERAVERHDSATKAIRLEWEDVYDRLNKTMGRLNARIRKSEGTTAPESNAKPEEGAGPPGQHAVLSEMRRRTGVLPR